MEEKNSRRKFLKTTTKIGAVATIGGLVLSACSDKVDSEVEKGVVEGKSNKEEILYQGDTKYWKTYYSVAK